MYIKYGTLKHKCLNVFFFVYTSWEKKSEKEKTKKLKLKENLFLHTHTNDTTKALQKYLKILQSFLLND